MGNIVFRAVDYFDKRRYLKRAKKMGKVQPQTISKGEYLESLENNNASVSEYVPNIPDEFEVVELEIAPEKIICPDCGGITYEGLEFCHKCGGEIEVN